MHNPKEFYLQTIYWILHYLKGTSEKGILFRKWTTLTLETYNNDDYAGLMVDRWPTSVYNTFLCGNLVKWRSKKHNVIARSSAEAEFGSMTLETYEL